MTRKHFAEKLGAIVEAQDVAILDRMEKADSMFSRLSTHSNEAPAPVDATAKKTSVVRQTFSMSEADFAILSNLRKAAARVDPTITLSEIIRVGINAIKTLDGEQIIAAAGQLERLRPGQKK